MVRLKPLRVGQIVDRRQGDGPGVLKFGMLFQLGGEINRVPITVYSSRASSPTAAKIRCPDAADALTVRLNSPPFTRCAFQSSIDPIALSIARMPSRA